MDQANKYKARPGHIYPKVMGLLASLFLSKLTNPESGEGVHLKDP